MKRLRDSLAATARKRLAFAVMLAFVAVAAVTCAKPRGEGYRRIELFSAGNSRIEFMCLIGHHSYDTFVGTTPWKLELDLDTMHEYIGGTHCRVLRANPGPDRLWVWAFDRDSLRLDKYLASPHDTVFFHMRSWICDQGKP